MISQSELNLKTEWRIILIIQYSTPSMQAPQLHTKTPLIESNPLSDLYAGSARFLLKLDLLQPSGSFKVNNLSSRTKLNSLSQIRGIGYKCAKVVLEEKVTNLVTSSGGNAGLAGIDTTHSHT